MAGVFLAMCLLGASACSTNTSGDSPGVDEGSSTAVPAPSTSGSPAPKDEIPRDDLLEERVLSWTDSENVSDTQVRVSFVGGNPACYGTRAITEQTGSEVAVALIQGTLPEAPEACTALAFQGSLLIDLDAPLGDRPVVKLSIDGAIPPSK